MKDSSNLFEFVRDNPIVNRDPDGRAVEAYYLATGRPGNQPWSFFMGLAAHLLIAYHYHVTHPDDRAYFNFYSVFSILADSGAGDPSRLLPSEQDLKPDITNTTTREVFEIKPWNQAGLEAGRREVRDYQTALNRAAPSRRQFRLGTDFSGEVGVKFARGVAGWRLTWQTTERGVVQYRWQRLNPRDQSMEAYREAYEKGQWVDVTEAEMQQNAQALYEAVQQMVKRRELLEKIRNPIGLAIDAIGTVATSFLSAAIFSVIGGKGAQPQTPAAQPGGGQVIPFPGRVSPPPSQPVPLRPAANW